MTPLYSHRLIHAFACEADFEIDSQHTNSVIIWEPLHVDAPADARPYCCSFNTIQFTEGGRHDDKRPWREFARTTHHEFMHADVCVLLKNGWWYEIGYGECVYHAGQWCMKWHARSNTRRASVLNRGWELWDK